MPDSGCVADAAALLMLSASIPYSHHARIKLDFANPCLFSSDMYGPDLFPCVASFLSICLAEVDSCFPCRASGGRDVNRLVSAQKVQKERKI